MKIKFVLLVTAAFLVATKPTCAHPSYDKEEMTLSKVARIRAKMIEEKSGIKFDWKWLDGRCVRLIKMKRNPTLGGSTPAAQYSSWLKKLNLPFSTVNEIERKYGKKIWEISPEVLSKDNYYNWLFDHELGHMLADQCSRYSVKKPFPGYQWIFDNEPMGKIIVSEGIGRYFEKVLRSPNPVTLSQKYLPESIKGSGNVNRILMIYNGGEWLTHDILKKHEARGLRWLVTHPFKPGDQLQKDAVAYKARALRELEQSK